MRIASRAVSRSLLAVVTLASLATLVRAQERTQVTINDTGVQAENLTSSQDGSVYFGSTAKGTIYRAAPGAAAAVTTVGNTAWVLVDRAKAVAVPYRPQ